MLTEDRDRAFEEYFESAFKSANVLTEREYENACAGYDRYYRDVLPTDENVRILDVGCGAGHFLYYLKKRGYKNFLGIDISPSQVEFCIKNVSKDVKVADMLDFLEEAKKPYGVIVAHDVLEHVPKKRVLDFLALVYKSLDEGGIFIVRVPNMSNPFSLDSRYRDFTHETGFTAAALQQILWIAGFRDIRVSSTEIAAHSLRKRVRSELVRLVHGLVRFLYYIQEFSVPDYLGKNLIIVCRK